MTGYEQRIWNKCNLYLTPSEQKKIFGYHPSERHQWLIKHCDEEFLPLKCKPKLTDDLKKELFSLEMDPLVRRGFLVSLCDNSYDLLSKCSTPLDNRQKSEFFLLSNRLERVQLIVAHCGNDPNQGSGTPKTNVIFFDLSMDAKLDKTHKEYLTKVLQDVFNELDNRKYEVKFISQEKPECNEACILKEIEEKNNEAQYAIWGNLTLLDNRYTLEMKLLRISDGQILLSKNAFIENSMEKLVAQSEALSRSMVALLNKKGQSQKPRKIYTPMAGPVLRQEQTLNNAKIKETTSIIYLRISAHLLFWPGMIRFIAGMAGAGYLGLDNKGGKSIAVATVIGSSVEILAGAILGIYYLTQRQPRRYIRRLPIFQIGNNYLLTGYSQQF